MSRAAARLAAAALALAAAPGVYAQSERIEIHIAVPGIGQTVAEGLHSFKFVIVDAGGATVWSNDGTSYQGSEPASSVELFVTGGAVDVVLGEPPTSSIQPLPPDVARQEDAVLRIWVTNASRPRFLRLPDRRIGGRGFASEAERARDAERLQGRRAADFETAGAVKRHEADWAHVPQGFVPGGRFYHASTDLGAGRELTVHFQVPREDSRVLLTLHASPPAGPPALQSLRLRTGEARNQTPDSTVEVAAFAGSGWLAGLSESYDFCNTCFKRKLPPDPEVVLDGVPFDGWKAGRTDVSEAPGLGRFEHFAPLGLIRFRRSLEVRSRARGADTASGVTRAWYYTVDPDASGAPGAIQVLLDGGDVTAALVGLPESLASVRSTRDRMVASRYDGEVPPTDALDLAAFLPRPADDVWLTRGAEVKATFAAGGGSVTLVGEIELAAGLRRLALDGSGPAALEILLEGRHERLVGLVAAGAADAAVTVPRSGWYQARLLAVATDRDLACSIAVDGAPPVVRTVPLLGGDGAEGWSAGPLDLGAAGIRLTPGPHELRIRERSGRDGHLEYALLVE